VVQLVVIATWHSLVGPIVEVLSIQAR
jgi:hypothetical protein